MHQKQNKTTVELLLENAYKGWTYHNMFKALTKDFLSTALGQQLLEHCAHAIQHTDMASIISFFHTAIQSCC